MKSADAVDLITMMPLMAAERPQGDIGRPFRLCSEFRPAGDQPQAIAELCEGIAAGEREQVLLGVTGSGKTFTLNDLGIAESLPGHHSLRMGSDARTMIFY